MKTLIVLLLSSIFCIQAAPITYGEAIKVDCSLWQQAGVKKQVSPSSSMSFDVNYNRKEYSFDLNFKNGYYNGVAEYETNDYYNMIVEGDLSRDRSINITYFSKIKENAVNFSVAIDALLIAPMKFVEYIPERVRPSVVVQASTVDLSEDNLSAQYYLDVVDFLIEKGIIDKTPKEFTATYVGAEIVCRAEIIEDETLDK